MAYTEDVSVKEFAKLAESFVALVDGYDQYTLLDFLEELNLLLAKLYAGAKRLPEVYEEEDEEEEDEEPELNKTRESPEERKRIEKHVKEFSDLYHKLSKYFGKHDTFTVYFDPYETKAEPVTATLGASVAEIYLDLEKGLDLLKADDIEEAIWEWKFGFKIHWGQHLVEALSATHWLLYEHIGEA